MRRIALIVLIAVGISQAQSNRSATTVVPPAERADPQARVLLDRGLKLLEAGETEAAAGAFADGLLLYGTGSGSASGDSMVHVALQHGAAVANLRLEKPSLAWQAIDRALLSRWTNDSLIFNAATVAITIRGRAITAVNLLDKHLAAHPDAKESWVNLFGLALEKAATDSATRARLEPRFKTLAEHQARLEATQPGKHRWGSAWLEESEYTEIKAKKDEADKKIEQLEADVEAAQQALQRAQQGASAAPRQSTGGGGRSGRGGRGQRSGGGGGGGRGGAGQATAARDQLTAAQKALDEADRGPQPTWEILLTGAQPVAEMTLE